MLIKRMSKYRLFFNFQIHIFSECKFVCNVCQKTFESQSKLDDHYRKHTGAKPFSCHVCLNTFRYKGQLQVCFQLKSTKFKSS
jgi:uncharacterized Zn-finger protein